MLSQVSKIANMQIPFIGLGTRMLAGQPCRKVLHSGLHLGIKLIDTNPIFKNEFMLADALKNYERKELFIINKVPSNALGYNSAVNSIENSLKSTKLDYFDLVLIESPGIQTLPGKNRHHKKARMQTWEALMKLREQEKVKHIGVANFSQRHIEEFLEKFKEKPEANMTEFHPWCFNKNFWQFHNEHKIQIIATCPLARANRELYSDPLLVELKGKYKKSRAQIILRWSIQKGVVVIPKSRLVSRLKENTNLDFEVAPEDIERLDGLAANKRFGWVSDNIK